MFKDDLYAVLVEQYFDLLSLSYRRRNRLLASYQHKFSDLLEWDNTINLYLKGLLLLSKNTEKYIQEKLLDTILDQGDIFAIMLYSAYCQHETHLRSVFTLTQISNKYSSVIQDIIHWAPNNSIFWTILSDYPLYVIYASIVRTDISLKMTENSVKAIDFFQFPIDKMPLLTKTVLRQCYEKMPDYYADNIKLLLGSQNDEIKLIAIESILDVDANKTSFFMDEQTLKAHLLKLIQSQLANVASMAVKLWIMKTALSIKECLSFIQSLDDSKRLYIQALGWNGDIKHIMELFQWLDEPLYARLSAAAIYTITGLSPEQAGWVGENILEEKTELKDEDGFPLIDEDTGLTWPDKTLFSIWWQQIGEKFDSNHSYLAGVKIDENEALSSVLNESCLALRHLIAERVSVDNVLLPVFITFPACQQLKIMMTSSH